VGTNRITDVSNTMVRPTQAKFMSGRHILEGVVVLHETIHELHRKNNGWIPFKTRLGKG
jgi:hypothetical protein